jgi:hypothetical protein
MLTAAHHFEVVDLWVRGELLGTRHAVTFAGHKVSLIFPANETDFGVETNNSDPPVLGHTSLRGRENVPTAEVLMIRIEVEVVSDFKLPTEQIEVPTSVASYEGVKILRDTEQIAREFAQKYISLVRAELDQFWLGPSESQLKSTWLTLLLDNSGNGIEASYGDPVAVTIYALDNILSEELNAAFIQKVLEGAEPDLAATFLTDAQYTVLRANDPNLRQAVLLAAIACEVKIKDTITSLATPEQRQLVDLLLDHPRDWTMAASSLYDKGLEAVCGRSLRKENIDLYKDIDLLFQDRNRIAHKGGDRVSADDILKKHIRSAKSVFDWLDGILNVVAEG